MNDMRLSSRHRIRNSSPASLRPSTLPAGYNEYGTHLHALAYGGIHMTHDGPKLFLNMF